MVGVFFSNLVTAEIQNGSWQNRWNTPPHLNFDNLSFSKILPYFHKISSQSEFQTKNVYLSHLKTQQQRIP